MTNWSDGRKFVSTGHPPDRYWMESGQTRLSWREKGPRSTRDSRMGSMENRYGLVPPQPGRRKRHADDGTLGGRYTDVKRNVDNVQWDDSQKRILFESEDLESISSGIIGSVNNGMGRYGSVHNGMGSYGPVHNGIGSYGSVHNGMGSYGSVHYCMGSYGSVHNGTGSYGSVHNGMGSYGSVNNGMSH